VHRVYLVVWLLFEICIFLGWLVGSLEIRGRAVTTVPESSWMQTLTKTKRRMAWIAAVLVTAVASDAPIVGYYSWKFVSSPPHDTLLTPPLPPLSPHTPK
jgi:hypothetical protein